MHTITYQSNGFQKLIHKQLFNNNAVERRLS